MVFSSLDGKLKKMSNFLPESINMHVHLIGLGSILNWDV